MTDIYSNFNTWCDNQQKIAEMKNTYTSKELQQNEEYQDLVISTPSIFVIADSKGRNPIESLKNRFNTSAHTKTIFDKIAVGIDGINDFCGINNKDFEETYEHNIAELGKGELLEKDSDKNGSLSIDEYIAAELNDLGETATIEEKAITAAYSHALFQILDEGTSVSDNNDELSAEELASYYKNVDRFENGELVETGDGKFTSEDASDFTMFLMENMIGQDNIDALYDAYIKKYTLEAEI